MSHSISHGYDDRVVQGIPVCPQESYVVSGIPVTSQGTTAASSVGDREIPSNELSTKEKQMLAVVAIMVLIFMCVIGIRGGINISKINKDPIFCVESASVLVLNDSVGNLTMARWNVGFLAKNPATHTRMFDGVEVELSLRNPDYAVRAISGGFELSKNAEMLLNATGRAPLFVLHETHELLYVDVNLQIQVGDEFKFRATCKDRRFDFSSDEVYYGSMVSNSTQCCSKRCSDFD